MSIPPVYIAAAGIISPLGCGLAATEMRLAAESCAIAPLSLFALTQNDPLPVGQVDAVAAEPADLPRTHRLALAAAKQAMQGRNNPPDAVIVGTTTGGMLESEELLRAGVRDRTKYRYHGLGTVAETIGGKYHCSGPMLTVSTACSSGAVALTLALRMLRMGRAESVLVGGVDSLCRLTYFGFHSLQLVDRSGCHPLDTNRQGMAVAEGAAMLLLTINRPENPLAELLGAGLTCDACHPAAPHPQGAGAWAAMQAALADAAIRPCDIDYINLHGTGTRENDQAEARAVRALFVDPPPLSSIKGATGHSLAAAGAIEAVVAALVVRRGFLPANTGLDQVDPALHLNPLLRPERKPVHLVLSNSFGFGGNNGSLVIGRPRAEAGDLRTAHRAGGWLHIHGLAAASGAGMTAATMERLSAGNDVAGMVDIDLLSTVLDGKTIRRLKRLPRMALALARSAWDDAALSNAPASVFMGTGWGALSETNDFLDRLFATGERFPSPTDFVGSVHNSPAGQVAIMLGATGANITTSGGDYSFEQAMLAADLMIKGNETALVLGADECHRNLSPLFDPSVGGDAIPADGGGGFVVSRSLPDARCRVRFLYYGAGDAGTGPLIVACGEPDGLQNRIGLVLAGIPAADKSQAEEQLRQFLARAESGVPVIRYRKRIGEFATATATAAVLAATLVDRRNAGDLGATGQPIGPHGGVLVLGLGSTITAMEFARL